MNYGRIFWGVILILIGALFALKNFDVLYFNWWEILDLWPLLLVFWGIGLLPVRSGAKLLLTVVALGLGLATVDFEKGYNYGGESRSFEWKHQRNDRENWEEQQLTVPFEEGVEKTTLQLDAAAGNFYIGGETDELIDFRRNGDLDYSLTVNDQKEGKKVRIKLKESFFRNHIDNDVDIMLNENPLWDFDLDIGAASMKMDLSEYRISNVDIDGGASSIEMRLGKQSEKIDVDIDAGASSVKIRIPEDAGCELRTSSFLTSKTLDGMDKVDGQHYRSKNFENASQKIYIQLDAAITSLKVLRY